MVDMPWQWGCHQRRRFLHRNFLSGPIQPPSAHYETAAPATPIVIDTDPHRPADLLIELRGRGGCSAFGALHAWHNPWHGAIVVAASRACQGS
jgi:hypothetical protein